MSKICGSCGNELPDDAQFCGICGTAVQDNNMQGAPDPVMQQEEWQAQQKRMQAQHEQRNAYTVMNNYGNGNIYPNQQQNAPDAMPYVNYENIARTKKDFLNLPQCNKLRKGVNEVAVACYIFAAVNWVIYQFNILQKPISSSVWPDIAFLVGMGLGLHLSKSIVFAIILTFYGAVNMGINASMGNYFGGWMILAAGVFALRFTIKINKEWNEYKLQNHII